MIGKHIVSVCLWLLLLCGGGIERAAASGEPAAMFSALAAARETEESAAAALPQERTSWPLSWVEEKLSAPNRIVKLTGISGLLSSSASVRLITFSDRQGAWLRIHHALLNWNRLPLLRGRLSVNALTAERIEILRLPLPNSEISDTGDNSAAAEQTADKNTEFGLPHLPIDIDIAKFSVKTLSLGDELYGQEEEMNIEGRAHFAAGLLNADMTAHMAGESAHKKYTARLPAAKAAEGLQSEAGEAETAAAAGDSGNLISLTVKMEKGGAVTAERAAAVNGGAEKAVSAVNAVHNAPDAPIMNDTASAAAKALDERVRFRCAAFGAWARLLPPAYRPLLQDGVILEAEGALLSGYGIRVDKAELNSSAINFHAQGETAADGFLRRLRLSGAFGRYGQKMTVPLRHAVFAAESGRADIDYGAAGSDTWSAVLRAEGLAWQSDDKSDSAHIAALKLDIGGAAENLDNAAARHISADGSGSAQNALLVQNGAAHKIPRMDMLLQADWQSGKALQLRQAKLTAPNVRASVKGVLENRQFTGDIDVVSAEIADFAALFGQKLSGSVTMRAQTAFGLDGAAFSMDLDGGIKNLRSGNALLNNALRGDNTVSGGLQYDKNTIAARNLRFNNAAMQLFANGSLNQKAADLDFGINLADIKVALPFLAGDGGAAAVLAAADSAAHKTGGAAELRGAVRGDNGIFAIEARAGMEKGWWNGRMVQRLAMALNGETRTHGKPISAADIQTQLSGSGQIGEELLQLKAALSRASGLLSIKDLDFILGKTALQGFLQQESAKSGSQKNMGLQSALWNGKLKLQAETLAPLAALAFMEGEGTADIELNLQAQAAAEAAQGIDFCAAAENFVLRPSLFMQGGGAPLLQMRHLSGKGHIQAENLLNIGNRPNVDFDATVLGASSSALTKAGIAVPLSVRAKGKTDGDHITIDAALLDDVMTDKAASPDMRAQAAAREVIRARGQISLAQKTLDLQAETVALPLALLQNLYSSPFLAQQNLRGVLTAKALMQGEFVNPHVEFSAHGEQITAAMLSSAKLAPLNIETQGVLDNQILHLQKLQLAGQGKTQLSVSGDIPLQGETSAVNMQIKGTMPLAALNPLVEKQGSQFDGFLTVEGRVGGSLQAPKMQGNFAVSQGQFVDAEVNLRLKPIEISGHFEGDEIIFDKAVLRSFSGGSMTLSGKISANAALGFPLQLQLNFDRFRYNDGSVIDVTAGGGLHIGGAVMQGALVNGKIQINKAEILIPESFGSAALLAVENKRMTPQIAQTQKRAGIDAGKAKAQTASEKEKLAHMLPKLDIQIIAPKQLFVRGHGLDAEMGGELQLAGRIDDLRPVGGFNLIRGKFDILSQRLIFKQGQVGLSGSLDPDLNFVAVSEGADVTVTVTVSGTPKDLKIVLASDPVLPQDEVLARLIFKRSMSELSPFQIAQLVDAAAELTGATSHSVLGGFRRGIGLDNLDVTSDAEGNPGVSLGRYLLNKLYFGVETSTGGASKGTVNLDISKHLKAKGSMGSDSNSTMGVFYERDY